MLTKPTLNQIANHLEHNILEKPRLDCINRQEGPNILDEWSTSKIGSVRYFVAEESHTGSAGGRRATLQVSKRVSAPQSKSGSEKLQVEKMVPKIDAVVAGGRGGVSARSTNLSTGAMEHSNQLRTVKIRFGLPTVEDIVPALPVYEIMLVEKIDHSRRGKRGNQNIVIYDWRRTLTPWTSRKSRSFATS